MDGMTINMSSWKSGDFGWRFLEISVFTSPDHGPERKCFEMNGVVVVMMDRRIFELIGGSNDMFNINS